jgi:hypothetical protein
VLPAAFAAEQMPSIKTSAIATEMNFLMATSLLLNLSGTRYRISSVIILDIGFN